jgi:hypothetical protein
MGILNSLCLRRLWLYFFKETFFSRSSLPESSKREWLGSVEESGELLLPQQLKQETLS